MATITPNQVKAVLGGGSAVVAMIAAVLSVEGGYVNHPSDPGGETNLGITKRVAVAHGYTGPMRSLPVEVAASIYYQDYLVRPGYEPLIALDAAVTEELFDTTVNMGQFRPSRWFQQAVNEQCGTSLAIDGQVGPATVLAFRACQRVVGAGNLCRAMLDSLDSKQAAEYNRLVRVNASLGSFHQGWFNKRIDNVDRAKCGAKV